MLRLAFDLRDAAGVGGTARTNVVDRVAEHGAHLGPALERRELDLEPAREPALVRPDALHGRTGVALDRAAQSSEGGS